MKTPHTLNHNRNLNRNNVHKITITRMIKIKKMIGLAVNPL
jgi:hypothetical protein